MSVLGRATIQPYNATKYAINGLTRGLACELAPFNIQGSPQPVAPPTACCTRPCGSDATRVTVNAIGPGYFATELTRPLVDNEKFNLMVTTRCYLSYRYFRYMRIVQVRVQCTGHRSDTGGCRRTCREPAYSLPLRPATM
jgi:NAD(P)-dependent dehydrogenase (short-subunit alcohol dehydrogenase family)